MTRHLDWDGCHNVRDLGGLPTNDGGMTRHGAVVRADAIDRVSADGWAALVDHGVRTVIDLRNDDERSPDVAPRPDLVTTQVLPLDASQCDAFWAEWGSGPQIGTPLYYGPFLERFPERVVMVLGAVARAEPGGVVVHCRAGRDRAGLVSLMLLALAGVSSAAIASDYAFSEARVRVLLRSLGEPDQQNGIDEEMRRRGATARSVILELLAGFEPERYLLSAGMEEPEIAALHARMT